VFCVVGAEVVLIVHFLFVVFVVFGGLCGLKWRRAPLAHLPALAWGVALELGGWICPLTPVEIRLRQCAGQAGYTGGFLQHYIYDLLYPAGFSASLQITLAVALIVFNVGVYFFLFTRWRRRQPPSAEL
jgi:hypothetical protein